MNILDAEKSFLEAIDQEDASTIRYLINLNDQIQNKYKNTYKGYKLIKETMQKNLLKSASMLINGGCPIISINQNTPLHIAVKLNSEYLVRNLIIKGADINIPDENEDYPIHIAINHEYYDLVVLLIHFGARIDVRNGNCETPLMLAIKLCNVELIKLFIVLCGDMNDFWPNTNETLFYYLTVSNPIPNFVIPYDRLNMELASNIVVYYLNNLDLMIEDIHTRNKNLLEFIIEKNLYDLLLRFNLDKMNLPFLKYKAIIHNRIDILDKLMSYNSIDNDSSPNSSENYLLFTAAYKTSNKDTYDILEKYKYVIKNMINFNNYFIVNFIACKCFPVEQEKNEIFLTIFNNENLCYWLKICFKRRFIILDDVDLWFNFLKLKLSLNMYANIFINMKPEYIMNIQSTLKCFAIILNSYMRNFFAGSQLLELFLSELLRIIYLNKLSQKNELIIYLTNDYFINKFKHVKHCVDQLKSIIIYENHTAFDFYLQNKRYRNANTLKEIIKNVKEKSNNYGIPNYISVLIIKRLEKTIKREILLKKCYTELNHMFDLPIFIQDKILSYFTRKELKLLCRK